jgi:hypothetical protein
MKKSKFKTWWERQCLSDKVQWAILGVIGIWLLTMFAKIIML